MGEGDHVLQTCLSHLWGEGYHALQTCLPPLVGGGGPRSGGGGCRRRPYIKLAAKPPPAPSEPGPQSGPSSRPLPSRCARHPPPGRGWAGNMEEKNVALKPCLSHFVGERRPRPSNLPPTARRGGGGPRSGGGGRRRRHYKKLAVKPPPPPSEPGPRSGPSSRPLPSRCARHPPPGRGWAGNMEEKNVASNPAYPILWRGRRPRPSNLPPTARRWEGDHKVVEGGRRRRHYKNCGEAATTIL